MPVTMLGSQLADLQEPDPTERVIEVDIAEPIQTQEETILANIIPARQSV